MKVKQFSVMLEPPLVKEARENLVLGQKLSPIINQLIKDWIETKKNKSEEASQNEV